MATLVRITAVLVGATVALGFLMFAVEQGNKGTQGQRAKIDHALAAPAPTPRQESLRERENGDFREAVDDTNDVLLSPFAGLLDSDDLWVQRGIPTLLALLIYCFGGLLLANFLPKPRHTTSDWREAT